MSFTDRIMVVIDGSAGGAVREMDRLNRSAKDADKGIGALGKTLKSGLVAGAAALVGTGLVAWLGKAVDQYGDAAKAAGELAKATGGTVENVSRFTAAMADSGVESEKSANLLRKFTVGAQKNEDVLRGLGVQFKVGKDGVVDYADAAVQAIDRLNGIGDAAERNRLAVQLFGKQGAAAFEELRASGVSLADSMEAVSKYRVFDAEDVARAVAYDDAVDKLGASMQGLAFAAGEKLIPLLSAGADALASFVEVMSGVPTEVYLAVGGFVALKSAMSFIGPAVATSLSNIALAMTGIGAAGGPVALAGKALGGIAAAIGPANLAMLGIVAVITAVAFAQQDFNTKMTEGVKRLKELKAAGSSAADALDQTAREIERSNNIFQDFFAAFTDGDGFAGFAKGLLGGPVNAVKSWVDALRSGGDDVDAYNRKLAEMEEELGKTAVAQQQLSDSTRTLDDLVLGLLQGDPSATWQKIGEAAATAAEQQSDLAQQTKIVAEQMALASGDVGFFIDKLQQLENIGGSSVESLKASLESITFTDVADTWANEALIGAEEAYDTILTGLKSALEQDPQLDLTAWLEQFRGLSPELDAVITQVLADVSSDANVQATLGITQDSTVPEAQGAVDALGNPINPPVDPKQGPGFADTNAALAELATTRNIAFIINTSFAPGGYEAVKARADYLKQDKTGKIDINTSFAPGGYESVKARSDFLSQSRTGSITINTAFAPGGYEAAKARVDYLSRNRTATITVNTVTRGGGGGATPEGFAARAANLSVSPQFQPVNMVRVQVDGRELRSLVDDEIRALTPHRQEVA